MIHRFAVLALGITLVMLVWYAYQYRPAGRARAMATLTFVLYLAQAGVGAMFVMSAAGPLLGAAHVGLAAATWALLVVFSTVEMLNTGEQPETQWKPQSEPPSQ